MATTIIAGNAVNNGIVLTGDNTGILELRSGTSSTTGDLGLTIASNGDIGLGGTAPTGLAHVETPAYTAAGEKYGFALGQGPVLTSGSTTASVGGLGYDGIVFYAVQALNTPAAIVAEQTVVTNTAYTLTSQTAAQKIFNNTANGAVTLPVGTYQFECFYSLSAMSVTSSSFGFAFGGTATIFSQRWMSQAVKAAIATPSTTQSIYSTAAAINLTTASGSLVGYAKIQGVIAISVAGTIIPQVSLGVAAPAVVGVGSYFRISPVSSIGSGVNITVGNWS